MRQAAVAAKGARSDPEGAGSLDGGSLEELIGVHAGELRRHLTGMLGRSEDAEDVLQEVWITAHDHPPEDGPEANIRAWLYRVATNRALDRLARSKRRAAALRDRRFRLEPETDQDPDADLLRLDGQARAQVRSHVARLPRKQREAVWLRWIESRCYDEIAARLECSSESARANVYNGMKRLRSELCDLWKRENLR
jgi:RNA polymerase sigma-70 factor (ECF subfamily)